MRQEEARGDNIRKRRRQEEASVQNWRRWRSRHRGSKRQLDAQREGRVMMQQ